MRAKSCLSFGLFLLAISTVNSVPVQAKDNELHFFAGATNRIRTTARDVDLAFQSSGLLLGALYSRKLAGPVLAEGGFAFSNAGRDSAIPFFPPNLLDRLVFTLPLSGGNTFLFEGGLRIDFLRARRFAPYVAVSTGAAHRTRILSPGEIIDLVDRVNLGGFTSFPVTVFISTSDTDFLVAAGGGVRIRLGERWGIRGEFRDRIERWGSLEFFGGPFIEF